MTDQPLQTDSGKQLSNLNITTVVYALQAVSFFFVITFIVAVIINYVKRDDVRGTWLESHFRWQIRTFWYGLLWSILGGITFLLIIGYFILIADAIWIIYRIAKGWLRLVEKKPLYT
ncbi:MAG: hypothetical protein ABIT92_03630 [Gammaproteobacteria bacterium]